MSESNKWFRDKWNRFGGEYLDKNSLETLNNIYPSTIFTEWLPSKFLHRTYNVGATPAKNFNISNLK